MEKLEKISDREALSVQLKPFDLNNQGSTIELKRRLYSTLKAKLKEGNWGSLNLNVVAV
jgi:hypothetical protein